MLRGGMDDLDRRNKPVTNFEKILKETTVRDIVEAMQESFVGSCSECPARPICDTVAEDDDRSCIDILEAWLESEAEE